MALFLIHINMLIMHIIGKRYLRLNICFNRFSIVLSTEFGPLLRSSFIIINKRQFICKLALILMIDGIILHTSMLNV